MSMIEAAQPQSPTRWRRGSPLEWALLAVLSTAMVLLYWYDLPMLMSIVCGVMIGSANALVLWRQHAGFEPRRHQGLLWTGLAASAVGIAIFLMLLTRV
jgi:hypothetical protein